MNKLFFLALFSLMLLFAACSDSGTSGNGNYSNSDGYTIAYPLQVDEADKSFTYLKGACYYEDGEYVWYGDSNFRHKKYSIQNDTLLLAQFWPEDEETSSYSEIYLGKNPNLFGTWTKTNCYIEDNIDLSCESSNATEIMRFTADSLYLTIKNKNFDYIRNGVLFEILEDIGIYAYSYYDENDPLKPIEKLNIQFTQTSNTTGSININGKIVKLNTYNISYEKDGIYVTEEVSSGGKTCRYERHQKNISKKSLCNKETISTSTIVSQNDNEIYAFGYNNNDEFEDCMASLINTDGLPKAKKSLSKKGPRFSSFENFREM